MRGRVAQGKRIDNDAVYLEDGLPNITGNPDYCDDNNNNIVLRTNNPTGCFKKTTTQKTLINSSSATLQGYSCTFDASKSNAKYGASDVVQPKAAQVYWFICVSQVPVENSGS